jgi:hypothetical protein
MPTSRPRWVKDICAKPPQPRSARLSDCNANAAATGCPIETMSVAQQVCRDDFRSGRIQCIDGWVLAQTELDVAALFTIA